MVKPKIKVEEIKCLACSGCISVCPKDALSMYSGKAVLNESKCIICGICIKTCPVGAIHNED